MKKLLILAYDFPPYVSVGGLRPYNWYRYLKEFGVEPIVVTRQWENKHGNHLDYVTAGSSEHVLIEKTDFGTILRTPYKPNISNRLLLKHGEHKFRLPRKVVSGFYEFAQFLYPVGPKSEIYAAARAYLKENKVDAIIASGDPFILFGYASQLSDEFNIPWIADYRDTWVQDKTRSGNILTKAWNSLFERRFLKNVYKITTVSSFIEKQLRLNLPNKEYEIILNGFNPDTMNTTLEIEQGKNDFTISFAGTIYKWHPYQSFLQSCSALLKEGKLKKLKINFFGINIPLELEEKIATNFPNLKSIISIYPKLENEFLVKELARTNAFLLFNDYSILGTKIFTYIGIKRKIILCYENDPEALFLKNKYYNLEEFDSESKQLQADLIAETNSGIIVQDAAHLKQVLQDLYTEFEETGSIACNSVGVEKYSRKIQVEKLAQIINTL